jgi:hypothetical protein
MEFDPILSDAHVPRYALESDSEDEPNPLKPDTNDPKRAPPTFRILGQFEKRPSLIVATGDAGAYWAKGANLGEQIGSLQVNNREVGLLFGPTYTKALILISEALLLLPLFAMNPYAKFALDSFGTTRLALLDVYATPTYVATDTNFDPQDPPIRFLSTLNDTCNIPFKPFETPNMINSTSASFTAIAHWENITSSLLLLPSPRTPPLHTNDFKGTGFLSGDFIKWDVETMKSIHSSLFDLAGESTDTQWALPSEVPPASQDSTKKRRNSNNDGMYI